MTLVFFGWYSRSGYMAPNKIMIMDVKATTSVWSSGRGCDWGKKCQKNNTFSIYKAEKSIPYSQKLLINEKKGSHKREQLTKFKKDSQLVSVVEETFFK